MHDSSLTEPCRPDFHGRLPDVLSFSNALMETSPSRELASGLLQVRLTCESIAERFQDFDDSIERYLDETEHSAPPSSAADLDQLLAWLAEQPDVSDCQWNRIVWLQSRRGAEFAALRQRLAHARFQRLLVHNEELIHEINCQAKLRVRMNPVHVWATFDHQLDEGQNDGSVRVLFFPVGRETRMAVLKSSCAALLRLIMPESQKLRSLLDHVPGAQRGATLQMLELLARLRIVALTRTA